MSIINQKANFVKVHREITGEEYAASLEAQVNELLKHQAKVARDEAKVEKRLAKEPHKKDAYTPKNSTAEVIRLSQKYSLVCDLVNIKHQKVLKASVKLDAAIAAFKPDYTDVIKALGFPNSVTSALLRIDNIDNATTVKGIGPKRLEALKAAKEAVDKAAAEAEKASEEVKSLKQALNAAVKAQNETAAKADHLQRMLQNITKERNVAGALAKDALLVHKKADKIREHETAVKLWRYGQRVVRPVDVFGEHVVELMSIISGKNSTLPEDKDASAKRRNLALAELEDLLPNILNNNLIATNSKLELRPMAESMLAETIFGVKEGETTFKLAIFDHDLWGLMGSIDADTIFVPRKIGDEEFAGEARVKRVHEALIGKVQSDGITLNGQKMEVLNSSPSGLKQGVIQLANRKQYISAFDALTCGLNGNIEKTNGQEWFKVISLYSTPSKVFTYGDDPENQKKLRLRDIIMTSTVKLRFQAEHGSLHYGKEGTFTVTINTADGKRNVKIPVTVSNNNTATISTPDGWDGIILLNLKEDVQAFQVRGPGMKGLAINIHGLVKNIISMKPEKYGHLAGKEIKIIDINGDEQTWEDGRALTTLTTWKMHKWFNDDWSKFVSNAEKLALVYPDYDCIRVVAEAEDPEEMETNRKTARQLLQQLVCISSEELDKLLAYHSKNAAKGFKFSGSFENIAGLGKLNPTDFHRLIRLVPELLASNEIGTYAMMKALDKLADLACGRAPTEEATLFLAQDISAMTEVCVLGADPDDPDIGVLKTGEFSCPSIKYGREAALVRFPSNGINAARVMKNTFKEMFRVCGNIIMINIKDGWIIDNDADCDGDHAAAFLEKAIINAVKRSRQWLEENGFLHTVFFEHGESAETQKPTKPFMDVGKTKAIVYGQVFNYVGRFANAALWAWAVFQQMVNEGKYEEAWIWYLVGHLFNTASILCIDWCKTGVPAEGSPNRRIFDAANEILAANGTFECGHAFARTPWAQGFRDHSKQTPFTENLKGEDRISMSGKPYTKHSYAAPSFAVIDQTAKKVMNSAGVEIDWTGEIVNPEALEYDAEGNRFALDLLGWTEPKTSPRNTVVDVALLAHVNPDRLDKKNAASKEDAKLIAQLDNGEKVGVMPVVYFLWRAQAVLERRFARMLAKADDNAAIVADSRALFYKVARTIVLGMGDGKPWEFTEHSPFYGQPAICDIEEQRKIIIDWVLAYAFGVKNSKIEGETSAETARKRANFAYFVLNVFAPDLLARLEKKHGFNESELTGHLELLTLGKANINNGSDRREVAPEPETVDEAALKEIFQDECDDINAALAASCEFWY